MSPVVAALITAGVKFVGTLVELILEAGGSEEDVAKLRIENTNAIDSALEAAKAIRLEVVKEIASKPDAP